MLNLTVAIIGLGLIGGSVAKVLTRCGVQVIGVDTDLSVCKMALDSSAVARFTDEQEAIEKSDIVIMSMYPVACLDFIEKNKDKLGDKILSDTTGVKADIVKLCDSLNIVFVGMHPMAGKTFGGFVNSTENLFESANIIIVPGSIANKCHIDKIIQIANMLSNVQPTLACEHRHDHMIAYTSQLPHVISLAVCKMSLFGQYHGFNGDSFVGITRVGNGINMQMWGQLFQLNQDNLLEQINEFEEKLSKVKKSLFPSEN